MKSSAVALSLFAPGNHARRVANALSLDADAVILDLEDAVATAEKPAGDRTVNRARQGVTADSLILSRPARAQAQALSRSPPAARR
jgi:citrate lyase beta subunit